MVNVVTVTAFRAIFAILPLKWQADVREDAAELAFGCREWFGAIRRNDTNAADVRENVAACHLCHVPLLSLLKSSVYRYQSSVHDNTA